MASGLWAMLGFGLRNAHRHQVAAVATVLVGVHVVENLGAVILGGGSELLPGQAGLMLGGADDASSGGAGSTGDNGASWDERAPTPIVARVNHWPSPTMLPLGRETFAVYDYGSPPGESRGDVLLLHGMADVARSLEPVAGSLIDRYRVLAFDARGHGRSSHPGAYSVLHFVADLVGVIDEYGLDAPILMGHSLGGHTVANYAGLYPDRVRAAVLLEGLGPPSPPLPPTAEAQLEHDRAMVDVLRLTPRHRPRSDIAAAAERLTSVHARLDPERALILAEEGTRPGPDGGRVWRHDERTWHWIASVDHAALDQRWAAITAPVLAVSGAEAWETWWARPGGPMTGRTRMTDEQFAARLGLFADIDHVELAEAGHMVHFDQPERINQLIGDFLRLRVETG